MTIPDEATCEETNAFADRFFDAIERADIDAVREAYDPDVEFWVNITRQSQGLDALLELVRLFATKVKGLHYDVASREFFAGGFVQRHAVTGELASGDALAVPACVVVYLEDGRITQLYEYLDASSIQSVFA